MTTAYCFRSRPDPLVLLEAACSQDALDSGREGRVVVLAVKPGTVQENAGEQRVRGVVPEGLDVVQLAAGQIWVGSLHWVRPPAGRSSGKTPNRRKGDAAG